MPRDYGAEYERREELAQERGYDSYYEERQARDFAYEMGADRDNVEQYAEFFATYEEGDLDREGWAEMYAELHDLDPNFDEWDQEQWDEFYAWLQEYYDSN